MNSLKIGIKEHIKGVHLIKKLTVNYWKLEARGTVFGPLWIFVKDVIFFVAYSAFFWLITGGNTIVDGMNRLSYLASGLIAWFFMAEALKHGSGCIRRNKILFTKMKFPITIIPTFEVLTIYLKRAPSMLIAFVIVGMFDGLSNFNILLFIYYNIAMLISMHAAVIFFSGFIALSADFKEFYAAIMRIMFYFIPLLWPLSILADYGILGKLALLNPLVYVIEGFRDAFVHSQMPNLPYTIYFWSLTLIVYLLGFKIQNVLRKYYSDYM